MWGKDKLVNEIEFVAIDKYAFEVCPKPFPASQALPQWWKNALPYIKSPQNPDGKKIIIENRESNASFKKCTPMLDVLSSGYVVPLWTDIQIRNVNNYPVITWRTTRDVFEIHNGQEVEIPDGYQNTQVKFLNQWIPKLPKGFSALIIPCPGYPNSVLRPISAIIDYDKTTHALYPPMYLKEGFEGIIEKGTPMFQVIPFKRDLWKIKINKEEKNMLKAREHQKIIKSVFSNSYKKIFWSRKEYN